MIGKSYFLLSLLQVGLSLEWKGDTPSEMTAQEGSCVQIPCRYSYPSHLTNQPRIGIWYKNEERGTKPTAFHSEEHNRISSQFRNRTRLSGDLKDGNCSLIIHSVRQGDAGSYYFRIEFDVKNSYSYYPVTRLHVSTELSKKWKCDTPREVTAQEGSCVQIPCQYSYPSCLGNQPRVGIWFNNEKQSSSSIAFHSEDHNQEAPQFHNRTRLSGDLKDGDCSLIINSVTRGDAGSYFFRIEFDGGNRYSYHPVTRLRVSAEQSQEWKGDTPREVTVQEGSCVQIPCQYSYPSCLGNQPRVGIWFNNEKQSSSSIAFHSGDHNQEAPQFRNRTRLSGDLKDGDCSLIINSVTRGDAGPYYFRIEFDKKNSYNYHPVTRLHVSDFTDKPTIFPAEIIAGKRVDISCTFNTTCNGTAPVLTWDTPTDVPGSVSNTVTQHGVTLTYTSVLTLIPSLKHHGHNLTCRVRYPSVSSEWILGLTVQSASETSKPRNAALGQSPLERALGQAHCLYLSSNLDLIPHQVNRGRFRDGQYSLVCRVDFCPGFKTEAAVWYRAPLLWSMLIPLGTCGDTSSSSSSFTRGPCSSLVSVNKRNSSKWPVGSLTAGIMFSVCVAGILVFVCVRNTIGLSASDPFVPSDPGRVFHCPGSSAWNESCCHRFQALTHRHTDNPDNLLYANINLLNLSSDDGTVHMSEGRNTHRSDSSETECETG
ncbi:uncharacterized protein LOC144508706 [Mustelus asterias]